TTFDSAPTQSRQKFKKRQRAPDPWSGAIIGVWGKTIWVRGVGQKGAGQPRGWHCQYKTRATPAALDKTACFQAPGRAGKQPLAASHRFGRGKAPTSAFGAGNGRPVRAILAQPSGGCADGGGCDLAKLAALGHHLPRHDEGGGRQVARRQGPADIREGGGHRALITPGAIVDHGDGRTGGFAPGDQVLGDL